MVKFEGGKKRPNNEKSGSSKTTRFDGLSSYFQVNIITLFHNRMFDEFSFFLTVPVELIVSTAYCA